MSEKTTVLAVFDCNVFAQALINPTGPAGECVRLARSGMIRLLISNYVIQEILELPGKLPDRLHVTMDRVERFLYEVVSCCIYLPEVTASSIKCRDAEDEPYIDLAVAGKAGYIVTRDKDLLQVMNPATAEGAEFSFRCEKLKIVDPLVFLLELHPTALIKRGL